MSPTMSGSSRAAASVQTQAAAAAQMLMEGVDPAEVGRAAGLVVNAVSSTGDTNGRTQEPSGFVWSPRQLAHLVDAVTSKLNESMAAAASPNEPNVDASDDNAEAPGGWWDPEALARLLCALRASTSVRVVGGAEDRSFMTPADQATLAHALATECRWTFEHAGDLLWCVHSAQEDGDRSVGCTSMARVEECAEVVIELARARAMRNGGCGWTRTDAAALLPRMLPSEDWDRHGLTGLSAVKGCALLAAALAAGGRNGLDEDGRRLDDDGCGALYPPDDDRPDTAQPGSQRPGWGVSDIAAALQHILEPRWTEEDEVEDDDTVPDGHEKREAEDDEEEDLVDRVARMGYGYGGSSGGEAASRAPPDPFGSVGYNTGEGHNQRRRGRNGRRRRRPPNSNVVGSVNTQSQRGVAGRGGGGLVRRLPPIVGADPAALTRPPRSGGWDPPSAALLAAELHGCYGWDVAPATRLAAEVLGWEGATWTAAADAAATLRSPAVGWSAVRAAEFLAATRSASFADCDDEWDVAEHLAPMVDRLVATHGWSPLETCALLEELMVWEVDAAADLVAHLRDWTEEGLAVLLSGLMS